MLLPKRGVIEINKRAILQGKSGHTTTKGLGFTFQVATTLLSAYMALTVSVKAWTPKQAIGYSKYLHVNRWYIVKHFVMA